MIPHNPTESLIETDKFKPFNVTPYLSNDYIPQGAELKLPDNTEFYFNGSSRTKHGVILISDTNEASGWKTGRIRNICDYFCDRGFYCVIPNLHTQPHDESKRPGFLDVSSLGEYAKSVTFDGNIKPVMTHMINFMRDEGIEKIALLGISWGGWAATNVVASDLCEEFVCAALVHPTLSSEASMYGGSVLELMSRVNRPLLLMPTKGDPDDYRACIKLLKYKLPSSDVIDFHDCNSGFLLHSSISDEKINMACCKALEEIYQFFDDHFHMEIAELVHEPLELGPESFNKEKDKSTHKTDGVFKDVAHRIRESAVKTGEKIKQAFGGTNNHQQTKHPTVSTTRSTGDPVDYSDVNKEKTRKHVVKESDYDIVNG